MKDRILLVGALVISAKLFSQTADSIKTKHLEEVVVTGQFEPQSAQRSVYKVRTISMERIQAKGAVKLQDVLNTELNIRFDQDLALGGSNITLQGLPGQNVKILIDGVPMIGRQGTSNEININQINVNSIERIEIVEGPMSVVYGADALAGVINIITKKTNDGKLELSAKIQEETAGKQYGLKKGIHNETVGGGYGWKNFHTRIDLSRNYFGGTPDTVERKKKWYPKTQYLASGLLGYTKEKTNVYYRFDYLNEDIYNPGAFFNNSAFDQNYISNRFMHQVQGGHVFSDRLSFNTALAYTDYSRKTQSTTVNETTGDVRLSLGEGQQDLTTFKGLTARGTFQYKLNDKLSFQPGFDINTETGEGIRLKDGVQSIGDYAGFVSAEWSTTSRIQVRPGIRVIHNTVYQAPPFIPSLNLKIGINDHQDIRLSYGRGFRAPSLRELYFNFIDASHNVQGNPNLEAELSHSFNGSWNWRVVDKELFKLTSVLGAFYNKVDNMISTSTSLSDPRAATYFNIDRAETTGATLSNTLRGKRWDFSLGFGYTGRLNNYYSDNFQWSPEVTSSASYKIPSAGMIFSFYYKYTGRTPYYATDPSDGLIKRGIMPYFQWADLTIQKDFLKHFTVTAGIRNLFDITNIIGSLASGSAHSSGGTSPIGYGRSYFASISYTLNK